MSAPSSSSFVLLVLAGLFWGTGGVTGSALAASSGLPAPAIAAYRLALGGGVLVALLLARRGTPPQSRAAWSRILAVAGLAAVFQCAYFASVAVGSVSAATLITIGSAPIFVVAAQIVRHRRRPSVAVARTVLVGITGLGLLVGAPPAGNTLTGSLAGAGLAALSGAAFAALTLLGRRPLVGVDVQAVTGCGFLVGGLGIAVVMAPFASLEFQPSARNLALLVLLATVPTALGYTLYFRGLRTASAATATVVALLEPLTGTVLAVVLLGDHVTPVGAAGALLLLGSVLDAGRTQLRAQRRTGPRTEAALSQVPA
ncbi:MAG: drug/metabolite transporter, family [Actinomycetota bacterium]|jgi:DME family drug/metabolite transporter|nr:drug/metabolite transporter, family [Actinomycetota bacterium]